MMYAKSAYPDQTAPKYLEKHVIANSLDLDQSAVCHSASMY